MAAVSVRCSALLDRNAPDTIRSYAARLSRLAVEHKPTRMIAQPLVVKYKLSDFVGKLLTLPLAFLTTGLFTFACRSCRLCRLDCVGRRT